MLVTIDRAGRSHVHAINAALTLYFPLSGDSTSMPSSKSFRWLNIGFKKLVMSVLFFTKPKSSKNYVLFC